MLRRYVALGDCEIAGKSGFAGQEVIVMGIDTVGAEIVADVEEPGGGIEEQRKIHPVGEGGRSVREALQAIGKFLRGQAARRARRAAILYHSPEDRRSAVEGKGG